MVGLPHHREYHQPKMRIDEQRLRSMVHCHCFFFSSCRLWYHNQTWQWTIHHLYMMFPSKHHLLYLGGSVATFDYWRVNMMLPQFYCSISPCLLVSSTVPIALDPLTLHLICFMFISQVLFNINHIPSCNQTWLLQIRNQWCFDGKIIYKL